MAQEAGVVLTLVPKCCENNSRRFSIGALPQGVLLLRTRLYGVLAKPGRTDMLEVSREGRTRLFFGFRSQDNDPESYFCLSAPFWIKS